jgi:hypothetical protein
MAMDHENVLRAAGLREFTDVVTGRLLHGVSRS